MQEEIQDLTIIGGGIMGLFTAYYASEFVRNITILEKSYIGDKNTASFFHTRSMRTDYIDPIYSRFAYEARQLWLDLERTAPERFMISCGVLNLAKGNITSDFSKTHAEQSFQTLANLHFKKERFNRNDLRKRFPQFDADLGCLDVESGFFYIPVITQTLIEILRAKQINIIENIEVRQVERHDDSLLIRTSRGEHLTQKLVMTAGHGSNEVLKRIKSCNINFPLRPDRPRCKYFIPPAEKWNQFTSDKFPVFAYLDIGVYGHPIYEGKTPGVKISFYNPKSVKEDDIESFIADCIPSLQDARVSLENIDKCFYDFTPDDDFILGNLPGQKDIYVGTGWNGTGYKFAPWVGKVLMQLALQEETIYDIRRFSPQRFALA